jgi:spermidine/putrescine transport system permease protein
LISRTVSDGALRAGVVLALIFMLLPCALVVLFSFSSEPEMAFPFYGPSLRWYEETFLDKSVLHGLSNSLILAASSSVFSVVMGSAAGIAVARASQRTATILSSILTLPLLIPPLILGISLSTMFAAISIPFSVGTAALGHTIILLPLTFVFVAARLARFDWRVEEASRDLGAGPFRTFFLVTLPAISPAIIGALAIAFAASLDEFVVTFFTIGVDYTLPTLLWSKLRYRIDPSINAIGTVLLLLSTGTMAIGARFGTVRL